MQSTYQTLKFHIVFYLIILGAHGWKKCGQIDFCSKLRSGWKKEPSRFKLSGDITELDPQTVQVNISDTRTNEDLKVMIAGYTEDVFRITIENPNVKRLPSHWVLNDELEREKLLHESEDSRGLIVRNGQCELVMSRDPFSIKLFRNGRFFIHVNRKNFLAVNEDTKDGRIGLDFSFPEAERAYGIPLHAERLSLRNTVRGHVEPYRLYNVDNFGYKSDSTEAIYGSVPVFYAHGPESTAGVFWLNTAQTFVDVTTENFQIEAHFMSENGWIDFFLFPGPTLEKTVEQYARITGHAPIPQYFTLGYHQSRYSYRNQTDVETVVENFDKNDFPMDAIWLDIDYTDGKKYFTWDYEKFPDPLGMQKKLVEGGRKVVAIIDPHVKVEEGYHVYDEGKEYGYFVREKDNETEFYGDCWPGNSTYVDFLNEDVQEWYSSLYQLDRFNGSTNSLYIWNDMNEPSVFKALENTMPKDLLLANGEYTHGEVHNIYGLAMTRSTYKGLTQRSNLRPFILTRSHFSGTQRYAAIWTGDNVATWEHLRISVPMCLTSALAGISFCGADVGGFVNNVEEELLQRWYQTGAWLPFFRGHSNKDVNRREPYLYSPTVQKRIRNAIKHRYVHLPYWYTLFYEHMKTGQPVIRPLVYHYGDDAKTFDLDNEWLIGKNILVSPVLHKGAKEITVYFPGSEVWYDIMLNKKFQRGHRKISVNLDTTPVFYRGGSIIPRKDTSRSSSIQTHGDPFTLYIFLDLNYEANGTLYMDDYESFEYKSSNYVYVQFNYRNNSLKWSKIDKNADYVTEVTIKEIIIYGPPHGVKIALVEMEGMCVPLKTSYGPNNDLLYVYGVAASVRNSSCIKFIVN